MRSLTSVLVWLASGTLRSIDQAHEGRLEGLFRFRGDIFDDAGIV